MIWIHYDMESIIMDHDFYPSTITTSIITTSILIMDIITTSVPLPAMVCLLLPMVTPLTNLKIVMVRNVKQA